MRIRKMVSVFSTLQKITLTVSSHHLQYWIEYFFGIWIEYSWNLNWKFSFQLNPKPIFGVEDPLWTALEHRNLELVRLLLEKGAVISGNHISVPIRQRNIAVLRLLFHHAKGQDKNPVDYYHVEMALKIGEKWKFACYLGRPVWRITKINITSTNLI